MLNSHSILKLKTNGFIKVQKFLSDSELEKIQKICQYRCKSKGNKEGFFSHNFKSFLVKILKLNFKKFNDDLRIFKITKEKKLSYIGQNFFGKTVEINNIDGYISPKGNTVILPWHTDRAYTDKHGDKNIKNFLHPDDCNLKIFIYLTNVGPGNGCMSYIPKSHEIGYHIRKGIFTKKLQYSPYWSLKQFREFLKIKKNFDYITTSSDDKNLIDSFMKISENLKDAGESEFDYEANPGDAIIFSEGGIHRGSTPTKNDRLVLRYFYKPQKQSYTVFE